MNNLLNFWPQSKSVTPFNYWLAFFEDKFPVELQVKPHSLPYSINKTEYEEYLNLSPEMTVNILQYDE
jgi:hypothetical protein